MIYAIKGAVTMGIIILSDIYIYVIITRVKLRNSDAALTSNFLTNVHTLEAVVEAWVSL